MTPAAVNTAAIASVIRIEVWTASLTFSSFFAP